MASTKSAAVRARLKHPVIDSDGHTVEFEPAVLDYLKQVGGAKILERYKSAPDGYDSGIRQWYRLERRLSNLGSRDRSSCRRGAEARRLPRAQPVPRRHFSRVLGSAVAGRSHSDAYAGRGD